MSAHGGDVQMRVGGEEAENLSPGVPGGTGDGNLEIVHMYNYTAHANNMQEAQ